MSTTVAPTPTAAQPASQAAGAWPLERILFAMAGTVTGLSALLAVLVSPWFLLLTGFVAINQLIFVGSGHCAASLVLERLFGVRRSADR